MKDATTPGDTILGDMRTWAKHLYDKGWRGPIEFPLTAAQRFVCGISGDTVYIPIYEAAAGKVYYRAPIVLVHREDAE